jgi:hypothetical protein
LHALLLNRRTAMPTSTDPRSNKVPRNQHDPDRQPPSDAGDEPRDFETQVSDDDRNYNAPFDGDLDPVEDEAINTDGSER